MINVYLTGEVYEHLFSWAKENLNFIMTDKIFFEDMAVFLEKDAAEVFIKYQAKEGSDMKMTLWVDRRKIFTSKAKRYYDSRGLELKTYIFNQPKTEAGEREIKHLSYILSDMYFIINAYLFYGNVLSPKERQIRALGKNTNKGKELRFQLIQGSLKAQYGPVKSHCIIKENIDVRGHYRHLQNGKVVWVKPHIKNKKRSE